LNPETIRAEWEIADGYYLYKDKFKFSTDAKGITLGSINFPKGKIHEDDFFGKIETYRHKVAVDIPITRAAGAAQDVVLATVAQGCADMGICYPPQKVNVSLSLIPPDMMGGSSGNKTLPTLSSLVKNKGGTQDAEFLPVDKAFAFSANVIDGNTIVALWDIADGYHLYKSRIEFSLDEAGGVQLGAPIFPKANNTISDEVFGKMEVYTGKLAIKIPLSRMVTSPTDIVLRAGYQGCAEAGFCYPPQEKTMPLSLPAGQATPSATATATKVIEQQKPAASAPASEQDTIAASLANEGILLIIATFFGFGLLLAFTPCVFPMIPILSSIIVGQGEDISTRKAFSMSLVYVLAMALTYTIAGVIAGLSGANIQAAFQNPWVLGTFSFVFVLLAFSMFGFYDLQLPASLQARLTEMSNKQKGGTMLGVAVMGFLSALIVGPCVAAPLAGALIYISQTGDAVLGGLALFALSMGMGAPLLAIGASAGKLLPRAGAWMEAVKAVFGVMLLAVAIWMLERIVSSMVAMLLWSTLLITSAVYMGALTSLDSTASGWRKLWKGLGVVMLIYGTLQLVGVAMNGSDPLQPLRGVSFGSGRSESSGMTQELTFKKIKSADDLDREVSAAAAAGKPVFLDFYADWCVSCKEMERDTFSDPGVQKAMSQGVLLKANVTDNDAIDKALMKRFNIIGPPSMIFYNRKGEELSAMRLVGFTEAKAFADHVNKAFQQ